MRSKVGRFESDLLRLTTEALFIAVLLHHNRTALFMAN